MFQPRSAAFQADVGEDIRSVLEAALLQARAAPALLGVRLLLAAAGVPAPALTARAASRHHPR